MKKNYSIGLDIGTTSVGWAVIDSDNYNIIRKGNKNLWGVRLFDEADTAEQRRLFRNNRRRFDRRRERIHLLQEEFKDEMNKVDTDFYTKLKESFFKETDVQNKTITISKEEKKMIKEYNKKYPTIYHLREALIESNQKYDIRLVYLALHHMIKYRGNFLYDNKNFKTSSSEIKEKLENVFSLMAEKFYIDLSSICLDYDEIESALFEVSKNDKKIKLEKELLKIFSKKVAKEYVKLLIGDTFSLNILFESELENNIKMSFKGGDFDELYTSIEKDFGEYIEILSLLKDIYDSIFLTQLFKNDSEKNISKIMVKRYEIHQKDLSELKKLLKNNKKAYSSVFKTKNIGTDNEKLCLYDEYIHNKKNYDEFTRSIKNYLLEQDYSAVKEILNRIDRGEFLPRITEVDNGKFPYQFNKEEMIKILENQGKYYPFLLNKTNDNQYRIVKLLEFRIPYYVGPLNDSTSEKGKKNQNAWIVKKEKNIKITPYNFNDVVDLESSAESFIERMIGNCTYLLHEKAMASNSILYSKFKVLNELKQIKIGEKGKEEPLTLDIQKEIFNQFFLKTQGNLTDKKFKKYLKESGNFDMFEELSVLGYSGDEKFANNMQSYIDFFGEDGIFKNTTYNEDDADEIIRLITIFDDKKILVKKIKKCIQI